jgi:ATP-binding cassette subfamily B protein
LSVFIALLELLNPWPMKIVIDSVLGNHPFPLTLNALLPTSVTQSKVTLLIVAVAAVFGLKATAGGLTILETYLNIGVRQRILLALKSSLFYHLQRLSLTFHDNRRLGDSIYRVNNDAYCVEDFVASTVHLLTATCTLVGMLWVVFKIDWQLALLSGAVAPFLYWSVDFYFKRFNPRIHRVQQMEAESTSIVQETLSNLRVVKAFAREDYEHDRFVDQGRSTVNARVRLTVQQSLFSVTVGLITAAGTALVLGLGAFHVMQGSLTVGELLVVLAYLASIYGPLEAISGTLTSIQTDLVKAERVFEVLDTDADVKDLPEAVPLTAVEGRVTFRNVGFGYREGVEVLQHLDFEVEPGQTVGIVGPTGAGKTSLVSLIPRFYDVTAGSVMIDGLDVRTIQLNSLRQHIALVLQDSILFSGTIGENIGYGRVGATLEEIVVAAKAANAHEFIMALPDQYESQVGEKGVKLSGGERQRISIARAFLKGAGILILDEPTSAVDTKTETVILEALDRLMRGRTTFIIAHRLSTLRRADQILVLQHGHMVERGSPAELLQAGNLYSILAQAQA